MIFKKKENKKDIVIEPEYLYHGTSMGAGLNIQKEGLRPILVSKGIKQVSLSSDEKYALSYAQRKSPDRGILLRIKKTMDITPDERIFRAGDFKSLQIIAPKYIEIKTPQGNWVLLEKYNLIEGKKY